MDNRPIGVFDSGIGGLTVLKEIFRELPEESTLYLGDTARVPYGIRSAETVTRYSFDNAAFLESQGVKLLVVACNTASAVSIDRIKDRVSIPVIGVIEPGAKAAARSSMNRKVGVIGTEATIASSAYTKGIKALAPDIEVIGLPCPLFVPLVEEGFTDNDIAEMVAERYLKGIKDKGIDTLVLGCTHYPLLKGVILKVMGSGITLIDSAIETVREVRAILKQKNIERASPDSPLRRFFVTDSPDRFTKVGERFLGQKIEHIEKINVGGF